MFGRERWLGTDIETETDRTAKGRSIWIQRMRREGEREEGMSVCILKFERDEMDGKEQDNLC